MSELSLAAGACRYRAGSSVDEATGMRLKSLEIQAQQLQGGIWSPTVKSANFDSQQSVDVASLYRQGKITPGVVEHVINGSSLKVLLLDTMHVVPLFISGIRAPRCGQESEPYGNECKFFVESRLL